MLKNHLECLALLEQIRWGGTPKCPYCYSTKAAVLKSEQRYHCNSCFTSYSVTVGTLFHGTHVDLPKWFEAIQLVIEKSPGISIRKLAAKIGVSKNTASYMIARIRKANQEEPELLEQLLRVIK